MSLRPRKVIFRPEEVSLRPRKMIFRPRKETLRPIGTGWAGSAVATVHHAGTLNAGNLPFPHEPEPTKPMNELITSYKDLPHAALLGRAGQIVTALSEAPGSVWFALAAPFRDAVAVQADLFSAALDKETCKSVTALRHTLRKSLRAAISRLAKYLEAIAEGDRAKLAETGYLLRKIPVRGQGPPAMPLRVRARPGEQTGTVKGSCKPVEHAALYEVQTCPDPVAGEWSRAGGFTDSRNFALSGLESGKVCYLRVRAIGANGPGPWGGPASVMVV